MKFNLKQLTAASLLALAGAAQASVITVQPGETHQGLKLVGGNAVLSFSGSLIEALNAGQVSITAQAPAAASETSAYDPDLDEVVRTGASANAPLTFMTVDDVSGDVLAAGSLGGAVMIAPKVSGVSKGGSLTVGNLSVNLTEKRVYADITGNFSGVTGAAATTLTHFHLWNFASLSGPTNVQVGAGSYTNVISGLSITQAGFDNFASALGLLTTGRNALLGVTDFGTITSTIVAEGKLVMAPQVPEPGTWALMGLGFTGIALAARRRRTA